MNPDPRPVVVSIPKPGSLTLEQKLANAYRILLMMLVTLVTVMIFTLLLMFVLDWLDQKEEPRLHLTVAYKVREQSGASESTG